MPTDYAEIGLKVGLEIHQQLDTKTKLFCNCKNELFKEPPEITFLRRLRPTQSELGQIDPAAYFEFQKGVKILYEANRHTTCLVEMDEEPPHDLNREALENTLIISLMLKAKPVDEIHVMRKTVIDGSNTTGFQRTCAVAFTGEIKTTKKSVPIQHISLEEDAARKTGDSNNILRYRIDRLCIPLVEIATAPVIHTPKEVEEIALAIGRILRGTNRVKRGLGTIRQDLNVSIRKGAIIEIKGVQELELLSLVVENEVHRQLNLLQIREELEERGVKKEDIRNQPADVTDIFINTKCEVIRKTIKKEERVLAIKLPKFEGLLKEEIMPGVRLGTDMADRAQFWGRTGGIFHTDELPAYGITSDEVEELKNAVKAKPGDAVVFIADTLERATDGLKAVNERAREALRGVPPETRAAKPDGSTRYMRPRPGAARMYPETDVPPIQITDDYVKSLSARLPELPELKMKRLIHSYGLNEKLAKQVLDSEFSQLFENAVEDSTVSPTLVAVTLTETLKALQRKQVEINSLTDKQFLELFHLIGHGKVAKEAIEDIIVWLSKHGEAKPGEAVNALGLNMLSHSELVEIVDRLIEENRGVIHEEKAFGVLMGLVMKKVRGRIKASSVSDVLKEKLKSLKNS